MKTRSLTLSRVGKALGALTLTLLVAQPVWAIKLPDNFLPFMTNWTVHGWLREYAAWYLTDLPETKNFNEAGSMSMNRQSLFVHTQWWTGPLHWTVRARGDFEILTDMQKNLQDLTAVTGNRADFRNEYDRVRLREYFIDWQATSRLHFRVGRQQVAWGQSDFFHATNVIDGYDFSWRKFLDPEADQVRKPLIMVNMTYDFPRLNSHVQMLVRPPIGDPNWIGNTEPTFGGPWANDGSHGFNFVSRNYSGLGVYNYHYRDSNVNDPDYGLRWKGIANLFNHQLTYALMYYHGHGGFYQDGTVIYDPVHPGPGGNPLQMVFPFTDTVGGSVSGFIRSIGSVYRVGAAYTPNRKMSSDLNGDKAFTEEDAYNFFFGLDSSPHLQKWLHTSNASLVSMQVFDWYIPGADEKDEIVRFDGSGYFAKHNIITTIIFKNPYFFDNLNLGVIGMADLTEGGGMVIPTLDYKYRTHWRFHMEFDWAMGGGYSGRTGPGGTKIGSVFGSLRDDRQLFIRVGYQF